MIKSRVLCISIFWIALLSGAAWGEKNARSVIDSLRWGIDYKSAEAFRRANQAKYLDSTYYVSSLIEGFHFYDRAEEQSGLRKAIPPLKKAIHLLEKDFGYSLVKRYTFTEIHHGAWREILRQLDYLNLNSTLTECYMSLEQPDKAYRLLTRLKKLNLAFDFRSYQGLAWVYFRSRIYKKDRYPFLKNSIEENIKMAFQYTDSLEMKYKKDRRYLETQIIRAYGKESAFAGFLKQSFLDQTPGSIANTRGILHGYNLQPDIAVNYFSKMSGDQNLAKTVNLGYAYHSDINFRKAAEYFSKTPDVGSKGRGGHWQGYSSIFVYRGESFIGALKLKEDRDKHGFTIGYGWDNLCLARMYLYSGMLEDCRAALAKAESFSEVHFNTSFREDQYQFMLKTLRLLENEYEMQGYRFENKRFWLRLQWWQDLPELLYEKYATLYQLANELILNPERDIVYYHIFHTESIVSFDELWGIIRNYSSNFFSRRFAELAHSDMRPNLKRYYSYFKGMLEMENGDREIAYDKLSTILRDSHLDKEYEKLLIARVHESCAIIASEEGWRPQLAFHLNELYRNFPQLIPFSKVQMIFRLTLSEELQDDSRAILKKIIRELKDCNINFSPPKSEKYPEVQLSLKEEDRIQYRVVMNRETIAQGAVYIASPNAGKKLAYRLFKVLR